MEKPTEAIADKIFKLFKNHQGKNWTLFLIILGVVHSAWFVEFFQRVSWWQWALQMPKANFEIGKQNPYFIFLEILFLASGITRFLVAIDIFYIIETCPGISDCITLLWKKRRDEWRRWETERRELHQQYSIYGASNDTIIHTLNIALGRSNDAIIKIHKQLPPFKILNRFLTLFHTDDKIPNHIQYWIKLEIKECKKEIAKEQGKKSFLDKTIIIGKKIGKYILSHV